MSTTQNFELKDLLFLCVDVALQQFPTTEPCDDCRTITGQSLLECYFRLPCASHNPFLHNPKKYAKSRCRSMKATMDVWHVLDSCLAKASNLKWWIVNLAHYWFKKVDISYLL